MQNFIELKCTDGNSLIFPIADIIEATVKEDVIVVARRTCYGKIVNLLVELDNLDTIRTALISPSSPQADRDLSFDALLRGLNSRPEDAKQQQP